jgi:tetratricopeptide (TPR) repeat protein
MRKEKLFTRSLLPVMLILLAGIAAYSNTFQVPFVFDDETSITDNPVVWTLDNFIAGSEGYDYNPRRFIGYLSFALNYHFGGFDVFGYHLVNLFIHLANGLLVFALVRMTFRTPFFQNEVQGPRSLVQGQTPKCVTLIALFAALLFVVHPVQTQAVTYIVQRLTSLVAFFYLLSLMLYITARLRLEGPGTLDQGPWTRRTAPVLLLAASVLSAVLAMRSKEIAFTLPLAVLLYEAGFFRGEWKRRLLCLLPILLTLPIVPLSILTAGESAGDLLTDVTEKARVDVDVPRLHYLFTQFRVIATYLRLLVLPVNQNLDYDYPVYTTFFTPPVFLSFMLSTAIFALALYLWFSSSREPRASRLVSFGLLWFFLTLSVESSLIPIDDVIFEHRLYLPSVGVFAAAAAAFGMLVARIERPGLARGVTAAAVTAVLLLSAATWSRNQVWQNPVALWQDVVAKSPHKARPYLNLGAVLGEAGRMEEAIAALTEAIRIEPADPKSHANLGAALASVGRLDAAVVALSRAARLEPDNPDVLNNYGIVLKDVGRLEEAIAALSEAVRIEPGHARAWYNLGRAWLVAGVQTEAVAALEQAIQIKPDYDNAFIELAGALNRQGRWNDAFGLLTSNLPRLADRPDARFTLGAAAHCLGDLTTSSRELAILRRLDPRYARQLADHMSRPCGAILNREQ